MSTLQEVIGSIELLPDDDKEQLFEMLHQPRIEERRAEILANTQEVRQVFKEGKAKVGTVEEVRVSARKKGIKNAKKRKLE